MADMPLSCFVISDGRRGIENQALGLAQAASRIRALEIITHKIENGAAFKAASPTLQFALKNRPADYGLKGAPPDIAIGCGRQAIAPLLALKKMAPDIFTVYVQDPRVDTGRFDLVIAPEHDALSGPNVESMIGSPNRVTDTQIVGETLNFAEGLGALPTPRATLLIGGNSKTHTLKPEALGTHIKAANHLLEQGYTLLVSTSRRTPDFAIRAWEALDEAHSNVWLHTEDGPNPYFAFLGGADIILVTEDSTNMLTEAASTGKPAFTLPMHGKASKFTQLYERLAERCHIRPFDGNLSAPVYEPLDETARIAELLWAHFDARSAVIN